MRSVSSATCTSGDPVSLSCCPNSEMISFVSFIVADRYL